MSGDVDAKAAAINEYGKLMLQHKVRAAHAFAPAPRAPHAPRAVPAFRWISARFFRASDDIP